MTQPLILDTEEVEVFEYLDELRDSGITNMYGATPYIQDAFDMDKTTARAHLKRWMETYSERYPS